MVTKKNPVVHFEMPLVNKKRAVNFYNKAFGWEMQEMGDEYGGYVMAMTAESDKNGPKKKGIINGGFYKKEKGNEHPSLVISVDNLKVAMKRVQKAGGKLIGKPQEIPNVGLFISFKDTEGNRVSMLQPAM